MAYQTRDVVDAMARPAGPASAIPRGRWSVGHGFPVADPGRSARRAGHPIEGRRDDGAGFGYLAGLAEGVWDSPADVTENWAADGEFTPNDRPRDADADYARWQRAVERSRMGSSRAGVEAGQRPRRLRTA